MPDDTPLAATDHEWRRCLVAFPRFGLRMDRDGVRTRLILPGRYLVRRSRSLGRPVYRSDRS